MDASNWWNYSVNQAHLSSGRLRCCVQFVMEKKHTVEDHSPSQQMSHHQMHQQLRRLISHQLQQEQSPCGNDNTSPVKVQTLSTHDTAVTKAETKAPPKGLYTLMKLSLWLTDLVGLINGVVVRKVQMDLMLLSLSIKVRPGLQLKRYLHWWRC